MNPHSLQASTVSQKHPLTLIAYIAQEASLKDLTAHKCVVMSTFANGFMHFSY